MSNNNNLSELNDILFNTLRGVQDGSITKEQAQTVTNVGNAIINNAKIQLDAFKLTKGKGYDAEVFGLKKEPPLQLDKMKPYDQKLEYSLSMSYGSTAEAIQHVGQEQFEKNFKEWLKDKLDNE